MSLVKESLWQKGVLITAAHRSLFSQLLLYFPYSYTGSLLFPRSSTVFKYSKYSKIAFLK